MSDQINRNLKGTIPKQAKPEERSNELPNDEAAQKPEGTDIVAPFAAAHPEKYRELISRTDREQEDLHNRQLPIPRQYFIDLEERRRKVREQERKVYAQVARARKSRAQEPRPSGASVVQRWMREEAEREAAASAAARPAWDSAGAW